MSENKAPEGRGQEGESRQQQNPMAAPAMTLPKGGGAIRGMGEKFAANPVTGTGSMSVPLALSPGRAGFGPQLSLAYDSGTGNGPFGFGWSLSLPAITRKTDKGLPQYRDSRDSGSEADVFILSGAEDLVPIPRAEENGEPDVFDEQGNGYLVDAFRPRIEGLFARIERWTRIVVGDDAEHKQQPDVHWRSISKDNILTIYGPDSESRICDPADPGRIFSWLIAETRDDKGNAVTYEYKGEDSVDVDLGQAHERNRGDQEDVSRTANRYPKRIKYGNPAPLLNTEGKRPLFLSDLPADKLNDTAWMFEAVFDYGEHKTENPAPDDNGTWSCRPDPFSSYRAGFEVRTYRLCQRVLMFHHIPDIPEEGTETIKQGYDGLVRSTDFTYFYETKEGEDSPRNPIYSFLASVIQSGYQPGATGYSKESLPPLEFEYSRPVLQDKVEEVDPASLENLPVGVDGAAYQWTDLHGEGIPGILTEQAGTWFYKRNLSPLYSSQRREDRDRFRLKEENPVLFSPLEQVPIKPNLSLAAGGQFMDLAGDGLPDLAVLDGPAPGLYEHDEAEGWSSFRPFTSRLNRSSRDPNLRFVDLDGDGHADILITEDDALVWYPSLGEEGFGPARRVAKALDEEKGPQLVFADGTESIYLADLSGDGLTDLARIRNSEVCYWPNLGHGRFGAKVSMDNAPLFDHPDQFNQQRIRLADIDGSGTTDIIYLHSEGVRIYCNQSGNSWGAVQTLATFPAIDNLAAIQVTDLLGNGTACLTWASPLPGNAGRQMRYVNLMGGQKPHLLIRTVNNMGAETRISYVPSTKFYLQDKQDNRPWISKLPFPVHVVERVETLDQISGNRFASRHAYHHGYFDGLEREFRGFGMVEQWDTEEFGGLPEDGAATNHDPAFQMPPVHTKTWFHTGAWLERDRVSQQYVREYYGAPQPGAADYETKLADFMAEELLPDTVLPPGLSVEEAREACRSLKGAMLRQEVYALDNSEDEEHPYTVTEQNFTVQLLQGRGDNPHGVFFTHPREAISLHYERDPADPRINHALTLEVDEFGNVRKEAAVGYGRRQKIQITDNEGVTTEVDNPALAKLNPKDQAKQIQPHVTLTENDFTENKESESGETAGITISSISDYRTPLPCESRIYEVTELRPRNGERFRLSDFIAVPGEEPPPVLETIAYHAEPDPDKQEKRIIEQVRTLYRKNDLSTLLPLGEFDSMALPGESYKLAFSSEHLGQVFQRPYRQELAEGESREELLSNGLANLLPAEDFISPAADAISDKGGYVDLDNDGRWWIPTGRVFFSPEPDADPATELVVASQSFFTPVRHRDPFGHETTVEFDHWLLPCRTTDALGNTAQAENDFRVLQPWRMTDPNGNRTALAFDTLGMVVATAVMGKEGETDPANIGDSLDNPTTRMEYELFAWKEHQKPNFVRTLSREQHGPDNPRWQEAYLYSDGFGRELQTKVQAEPGDAPERAAQEADKPYTPGPLIIDDSTKKPVQAFTNSRWVGTGRVVYNNKGKPVKQYEPFFSSTHLYEDEPEMTDTGVTPVLFYDPLGRVIATLHPNHTYEKVVFDPWRQVTYDVNDTVTFDPKNDVDVGGFLSRLPDDEYLPTWHQQRINQPVGTPEQVAAQKAAAHADTPTTAHLDSLGRPFLTIAHNRVVCPDHTNNGEEDRPETRVELDIEGNQRSVEDAKGRIVMRYEYDMLGTVIQQASMEAGERWVLNDITGNPICTWDSRGFSHQMKYDALRRPVAHYVSDKGQPERQVEKTIYGDTPGVLPNPELTNHRGQPYKVFDNAGVVTSEAYDFKGNLMRSSRQLRQDYKETANWEQPDLEEEIFRSRSWYDALNRPVQLIAPHSDREDTKFDIIRPGYNEANLLERVDVWSQQTEEPEGLRDQKTATLHAVTNIDYDAKGQRQRIEYGVKDDKVVVTRYEYDEKTYRLIRLLTTRGQHDIEEACTAVDEVGKRTCADPPEVCNKLADNRCVLQDLRYTYDPAGNITRIEDQAQQRIFFRNKCVDPTSTYTYDALYRLIEATGREHLGTVGNPSACNDPGRTGLPLPNDCGAMRNYTERYIYDEVGNFEHFIHKALGGDWQRDYHYEVDSLLAGESKVSNRLSKTILHPNGDAPRTSLYNYDEHGNMDMPHLESMEWDHNDQLAVSVRQDKNNGGTPETTFYVYDASGQRVRKVTERQAAADGTPVKRKERIYLGGFEVYREWSGDTCDLERLSLHVMDDKQRIALVETKTVGQAENGDPLNSSLVRYQLGNHLGSASLELDGKGALISYEEYHPYGTTAFQLHSSEVSRKRYRYTGMERDEETGLNYHSARYYAGWLGRWCSCDPVGLADGVNSYTYVRANPIVNIDTDGRQTAFTYYLENRGNRTARQHTNANTRRIQNNRQRFAAIRGQQTKTGFLSRDQGRLGEPTMEVPNAAHALIEAFRDPNIRDESPSVSSRLDSIIEIARSEGMMGEIIMTFREETIRNTGDTGFRRQFQDQTIWPGSGDQIGHFLGAVRAAHSWPSHVAWSQMLAHEFEREGLPAPMRLIGSNSRMTSDDDYRNFRSGRLDLIPLDTSQFGVSYQDLYLTYFGLKFAEMVDQGRFSSKEEASRFLEFLLTPKDLSALPQDDFTRKFSSELAEIRNMLTQFERTQTESHRQWRELELQKRAIRSAPDPLAVP